MPLPSEFLNNDELSNAIDSMSGENLRRIIKDVCQRTPAAKDAMEKKVLVKDDQEKSEDPKPVTGKRVRTRYAMCERCEKEFDVTSNSRTSCYFHDDDDCSTNEDLFPDHEEETHGPIDTPENRREYPEKFYYYCCGRNMTQRPCQIGWHVEDTAFKRARVD